MTIGDRGYLSVPLSKGKGLPRNRTIYRNYGAFERRVAPAAPPVTTFPNGG